MDIQKGHTAEVFDYDGERVCKLFYQEIPYEYVQQEFENARKLFELGIRVPEVFEIVNYDGRCGIVYEKIAGLPMWEHMQNECLFEKFIAEHKKLLDISTDVLMSYKDFLIAMICGGNNREVSGNIIKRISDLPDGNSADCRQSGVGVSTPTPLFSVFGWFPEIFEKNEIYRFLAALFFVSF